MRRWLIVGVIGLVGCHGTPPEPAPARVAEPVSSLWVVDTLAGDRTEISLVVENGAIGLSTSGIDRVVEKGLAALPALLTVLEHEELSFDTFCCAVAASSAILRQHNPGVRVPWGGGVSTDGELTPCTRLKPGGQMDLPQFRRDVAAAIRREIEAHHRHLTDPRRRTEHARRSLRLSVEAARPTVRLGEQIEVTFYLLNRSDRSLEVPIDLAGNDMGLISFVDLKQSMNGEKESPPSPPSGWGAMVLFDTEANPRIVLQPHERRRLGNKAFLPDARGRCDVRGDLHLPLSADGTTSIHPRKDETGFDGTPSLVVRSNEVRIVVE